ncbi:aminoacyl-tRNA hydrolase [Chengkuizengella axinellae]|uniref:Peptidyl-tRNA hydrolase n=1 Tax=Chengkuizengella axinellae TaxID=3064388 RepID=A0ABT9J5Q9_9BACL|nr:aminoacyl-tRNA hydrolase [Chengkuizengella sp. 2205SS18-9]MDP5276946.1 aminoacyl-tRNA hydrolase [Chengkuizengella sp. 2205SS18-9]
MKWIVGLGNPGKSYEKTKHNVGFMVVDRFAELNDIKISKNKCKSLIGEGSIKGQKVVLIKPMTYMNLSGEAVRAFMDYYDANLEDMIVVYDDIDMDFGKLRLRYKGSAGGNNGIKSIISHTGTQSFNRIRFGISRPPKGYEVPDYVLSKFHKNELETLDEMISKSCDALSYALDESFEKTMAKFN